MLQFYWLRIICQKMKNGSLVDEGTCDQIIKKHGRSNLEETFLKIARGK